MDLEKFTPRVKRELEIIYSMYGSAIKRIAHSILKDECLAEDCTHNVIISLSKVLEKIGEYGSREARVYIYVITKNEARNIKKKHDREVCAETIDNHSMFRERHSDVYFADKMGFSPEIGECLSKINEIDREIILLRYGYDLKYSDIAKHMKRSVNSVEQRASRARKKLELMLLEAGGHEDEEK